MANRKTHLKHQSRRSATAPSNTKSKDAPKDDSTLVEAKSVEPKEDTIQAKPQAEFTQLSAAETQLVWLELRHRVYTVGLVLVVFTLIWLVFHFTQVDEKIYSLFNIAS